MEEEISAPKGSILEQLTKQDLSLQGVEELSARIALLKEEITRAEAMLSKKGLPQMQKPFSNKFSRGLADKAVEFFVKARHATASVNQRLRPFGPSRMGGRINIQRQRGALFAIGRACLIGGTIGHGHRNHVIIGMNVLFIAFSFSIRVERLYKQKKCSVQVDIEGSIWPLVKHRLLAISTAIQ